MIKTGEILKTEREKQKKTINEVSQKTKININVLKAIEEGREADLPAKSFLRGFVRTYAKYLELNEKMVMDTFFEEVGSTNPVFPSGKELAEKNKENEQPLFSSEAVKPKAIAVAAITVIIVVALGLKGVVEKYQEENIKNQAAESLSPEQKIAATKIEIKAQKIKNEKTKAAVESDNKELVKTDNKLKISEEKKEETKAKEEVVVKKEEAKPKEEPKAVKKEEPKKNLKPSPQEVVVEALDHIEIEYVIDGKSKKVIEIKPSKTFIFRSKFGIELKISDGGALQIYHNGVKRGVPGTLGKSLTLNYPKR